MSLENDFVEVIMSTEVKLPTCSTCLFSARSAAEELFCRFSHRHATLQAEAAVDEDEYCGDGAWRPKSLGLEVMNEGAVGYVVARLNVEIALEEAEKRVVVARRSLVGGEHLQ